MGQFSLDYRVDRITRRCVVLRPDPAPGSDYYENAPVYLDRKVWEEAGEPLSTGGGHRIMTTELDLRVLNSMTKYPSIPTYHYLDPANGRLSERVITPFPEGEPVVVTEKVDGTNARLIVVPSMHMWLIGSRDELLTAQGDRVHNPALGIVDAVRPIADRLLCAPGNAVTTYYMEVYGGKVGKAARSYSADPSVTGVRLFDVSVLENYAEILSWPVERVAAWRDAGGQTFLEEGLLTAWAQGDGLEPVPRLATLWAADEALPTSLEGVWAMLETYAAFSRVALGDITPDRAEGLVLRTRSRSAIAKARWEDYRRSLGRWDKPRRQGGRRG